MGRLDVRRPDEAEKRRRRQILGREHDPRLWLSRSLDSAHDEVAAEREERRRLELHVERGDVDLVGESRLTLDRRIGGAKGLLAFRERAFAAIGISEEESDRQGVHGSMVVAAAMRGNELCRLSLRR